MQVIERERPDAGRLRSSLIGRVWSLKLRSGSLLELTRRWLGCVRSLVRASGRPALWRGCVRERTLWVVSGRSQQRPITLLLRERVDLTVGYQRTRFERGHVDGLERPDADRPNAGVRPVMRLITLRPVSTSDHPELPNGSLIFGVYK
jgi:hypothetical protein